MSSPDAPLPPAVAGYAEGQDFAFIHTEASDTAVARLLSDMMDSPVAPVPRLAGVPEDALANVYVFRNGVQPRTARGPFGFQPDVFDCPPGGACYSPLRSVTLVSWVRPQEARVLRSAEEVRQALDQGLVHGEPTGVVVNMPALRWREWKR